MKQKGLEIFQKTISSSYFNKQAIIWVLKWMVIAFTVALLSGSASAFFLAALDKMTQIRESNTWIVIFLPIAGVFIVWMYNKIGKESARGNNLILEEVQNPTRKVPLIMAPLVLLGTLITHLFGGSAGREGTAVQMGASLADKLSDWFKLQNSDRPILLICGISGGFASVFGTPLAGAVFALEVFTVGRVNYKAIFPSLFTAILASYIVDLWQVHHVHYSVDLVPDFSISILFSILLLGTAFGLAARFFIFSSHFFNELLGKVKSLSGRAALGGAVVAAVFLVSGSQRYAGLGIPLIQESFEQTMPWYDFLMKIVFTTFTLSSGFKGGEVTPLFFTGATLGSFLSQYIGLPIALSAAMGFVAVFSGATNTPIACTLMSIELFGAEPAVFCALSCVLAYLVSGNSGIYTSQKIEEKKIPQY